jgi:hypothetical protein
LDGGEKYVLWNIAALLLSLEVRNREGNGEGEGDAAGRK